MLGCLAAVQVHSWDFSVVHSLLIFPLEYNAFSTVFLHLNLPDCYCVTYAIPAHEMEVSFVSKARTAFHSAAAKAEKVFADIKKSDSTTDRGEHRYLTLFFFNLNCFLFLDWIIWGLSFPIFVIIAFKLLLFYFGQTLLWITIGNFLCRGWFWYTVAEGVNTGFRRYQRRRIEGVFFAACILFLKKKASYV